MTFCWLTCRRSLPEMGSTLTEKNLLRGDEMGGQNIMTELRPLKVYPFTLTAVMILKV